MNKKRKARKRIELSDYYTPEDLERDRQLARELFENPKPDDLPF